MVPVRDECRSCRAPIVWVAHERTGKPAPIEVEPRSDGNVLFLLRGEYGEFPFTGRVDEIIPVAAEAERLAGSEAVYRVLGKTAKAQAEEECPHVPRYASHFVGCPSAPHWRDRQGAS